MAEQNVEDVPFFVAIVWYSEVRESDLYADIVGGLNREGCMVFKIADGALNKKPFDIAGTVKDGRSIGVEAKLTSRMPEAVGPDWSTFETHQVTWLRSYAAFGAVALAAVYDRQHHKMHVWRLRDANDKCDRPADAVLEKTDGFYTGWRALL